MILSEKIITICDISVLFFIVSSQIKISFRNIITKEIEDVNEFTQFTFEFKIKDIKKIFHFKIVISIKSID